VGSPCQLSRSEVRKDKVSKGVCGLGHLQTAFVLWVIEGIEVWSTCHICEDKPEKSVRQVIEACAFSDKGF